MSIHFLKFDKIIRELRSAGANLEESDTVCHLLLIMPSEYNTVVTAIQTLASDELTIRFIKNKLLDEECKRSGARRVTQKETQFPAVFMVPAAGIHVQNLNVLIVEWLNTKTENRAKYVCEVDTELCFVGLAQDNGENSWYLDS